MSKLSLLFVFIFVSTTIFSLARGQENVTWAKRVDNGKEVVTTLQFYFHDIVSGRNSTVVKVAEGPNTTNPPTLFGTLNMVDDALTIGPEPTSKLVGRARGLYGISSQYSELCLIMAMSYSFVDGIYDGSSFSLLSQNTVMHRVREMAIVGGTGMFRMARGFAIAQTYSADFATGDAVVGYNVTIVTYV